MIAEEYEFEIRFKREGQRAFLEWREKDRSLEDRNPQLTIVQKLGIGDFYLKRDGNEFVVCGRAEYPSNLQIYRKNGNGGNCFFASDLPCLYVLFLRRC